MKKALLSMAAIALIFTSCSENQNEIQQDQTNVDMTDFYVYTDADIDESSRSANSKSCYSMVNLNRMLNENPGLEKKMYDIEFHTRKLIAGKGKPPGAGGGNGGGGNGGGDTGDVDVLPISDNLGVINIPVYVHVVYADTNSISNSQIQSQINVLNSDFSNTNVNQLPSGTTFVNDATNAGFQFTLAGTFKHADSRSSWGTNDAVKNAYPPVTPETHLNIWVCNIGGGIIGYAQFPGGNLSTDGIVVGGNYFGITSGVYGGGRTATHEIGHYFNLRHIWGDGRCNRDDFVADTPKSDRSNGGCPSYPTVHCKDADMTMNYMDYTYDSCMYMFTDGQRNRMRAIFASGGARASMVVN